jgi:hypothetical protein
MYTPLLPLRPRAIIVFMLFTSGLASSSPGQIASPRTAELMKTFVFTPGQSLETGQNSTYDIFVERGSESIVETKTNSTTNRKVLSMTLNPRTDFSDGNETYGGKRAEFEWRPKLPGLVEPASYRYLTNTVDAPGSPTGTPVPRDLWVGFRVRVVAEGDEQLVSLFQFGPVRDNTFSTKSIGYYQLCLRKRDSVTLWSWRAYAAPAFWNDPPAVPPTEQQIAELFVSTPTSPINRNPSAAYFDLDKVVSGGQVKNAVPFVRGREETWVARLRMRAEGASTPGRVTLWSNGKLVLDVEGANAFPKDFTRVKWGPYGGPVSASITAEYVHLGLAEGNDDGYRLVAPGTYQTLPASGVFSRVVAVPAGTGSISIRGLPFGWTFNATTKEISGPASDRVLGARILISFRPSLDEASDPLVDSAASHVVWIFPGDAEDPAADMDNDGVANKIEAAAGTDPRNSIATPLTLGLTAENRVSLGFVRARADALYSIEATHNLVSWETLVTNPGTVATEVTWEDPTPVHLFGEPRRFYRLRVSLPGSSDLGD